MLHAPDVTGFLAGGATTAVGEELPGGEGFRRIDAVVVDTVWYTSHDGIAGAPGRIRTCFASMR